MRRWTKQIRALELLGEKNRLGRGSNLGQAGGNLCLCVIASPPLAHEAISIVRKPEIATAFFKGLAMTIVASLHLVNEY